MARKIREKETKKLELMDKMLSKSKLTEEDAERIGRKIKHEIAKRHGLTVLSQKKIKSNKIADKEDLREGQRIDEEIKKGKQKVYSKKEFMKLTGAKLK